jgi:uncharacterized protein with beta-barrel porin domain
MTEAQLYERLGRQQVALEQAEANFAQALQCMAHMLSGEIDPSRVMVNLTDKSFCWSEPGTRPPRPMTINGLPECVTAPEPKPDPTAHENGNRVAEYLKG